MITIARFQIPQSEAAAFSGAASAALAALAECDGFKSGEVGQNTDEPGLWTLVSIWKDVGSYRRALSNNQVKMLSIPLLARAIDEPGAYINATSE
ncbi:MAG: antibiotic biosynthesis monooxygenase [Actinomycetes bacterium]